MFSLDQKKIIVTNWTVLFSLFTFGPNLSTLLTALTIERYRAVVPYQGAVERRVLGVPLIISFQWSFGLFFIQRGRKNH